MGNVPTILINMFSKANQQRRNSKTLTIRKESNHPKIVKEEILNIPVLKSQLTNDNQMIIEPDSLTPHKNNLKSPHQLKCISFN